MLYNNGTGIVLLKAKFLSRRIQDGFVDRLLSLFDSSAMKLAIPVLLVLMNSDNYIGILKVGRDDTRCEGLFLRVIIVSGRCLFNIRRHVFFGV